jgi:Inner membrane protein YgaP-like, transmembrane domain
MMQNMGTVDRALRALVVGPVAIVVAFLVGTGTVGGIILFVFAGINLATGLTGYCPNYTLIGITTQHGMHRVPRSHLRGRHA